MTQRPITESELIKFLAMKCDDEMRERIARQSEIVGIPVQKWLAEMDEKLSDPFNIDWGKVAFSELEDEDGSTVSVDSLEQELARLEQLVKMLCERGQFNEAQVLQEHLVSIRRNQANRMSELDACIAILGGIALRSGDFAVARHSFGDLVEYVRKVRESYARNALLARYLNNLGVAHLEEGDLTTARQYILESLKWYKTCRVYLEWMNCSWERLTAFSNRARLCYARGDYAQARREYEELLEVQVEDGDDELRIATTLDNLSASLSECGEVYEAEERTRESVDIKQRLLPSDHPDIAITLNNLGVLLMGRGEFQEASQHLQLAVDMFASALGTDSTPYKFATDNLDKAQRGERKGQMIMNMAA